MERSERVQDNVDKLIAAGVSMSMDDFGTGYSSLSNLQALPVCRLKVDASFVRGIGVSRDDEKIVEAVIRLGQSMGLTVVAEGVETAGQLEFLRERGCDEIQGYYISKPLSPEDFRRFVHYETCGSGLVSPLNGRGPACPRGCDIGRAIGKSIPGRYNGSLRGIHDGRMAAVSVTSMTGFARAEGRIEGRRPLAWVVGSQKRQRQEPGGAGARAPRF